MKILSTWFFNKIAPALLIGAIIAYVGFFVDFQVVKAEINGDRVTLGKVLKKIEKVEDDIKWLRNFLLTNNEKVDTI